MVDEKPQTFADRYASDAVFKAQIDSSRRKAQFKQASQKRKTAFQLMSAKTPDPKTRLY